MIPRIVEAHYVASFRVWLRFTDGAQGEIDLFGDLVGPMFDRLRDVTEFRRFSLDPDLRTLVWPNGADFAPEFLRDKLRLLA
jgi:hypothetical protein